MSRNTTYEYALTPTTQFYFCSVPFRFDISPRCGIGCKYCFSTARGGKLSTENKMADPVRLERKLDSVFCDPHNRDDICAEFLKRKVPMHIGGLSDPFSNLRYTKRMISILTGLAKYDYPVIISTKHTTNLLREDVLKVLSTMKYISLQVSMPIPDDKLSRSIEPGAPLFSRRLRDMEALSAEGFHLVARFQPVIYPILDRLNNDLIQRLDTVGCRHVVVENLKIPVEKNVSYISTMFKLLRWDGYAFYKTRGAIMVGRDWVLPPAIAWENIRPFVNILRENKFSYGTTDHGLFHFGSTSCCCGVAERKGFDNVFRANFANIIRRTKRNTLYFSDIKARWIPRASVKRYINSNSRLPGQNTVLLHLRNSWNRPGTINAPDAYLGIRYTGRIDRNGDCIYDKSSIGRYLGT